MQELNELENSIFQRLAIKYPNLASHLPSLKVKCRTATGVGMYVDFVYDSDITMCSDAVFKDTYLSIDERIMFEGLEHGLIFEVDIDEGKINCLELVTIGEDWDGTIPTQFTFRR
jgi:hypothetical protein